VETALAHHPLPQPDDRLCSLVRSVLEEGASSSRITARLGSRLPLLLGSYAYGAALVGSTTVLVVGRRSVGLEAPVAQLLMWQALNYGLWLPVAWVAAVIFAEEGAFARLIWRCALLGLIAAPAHSILGALLDLRFSVHPKPLLPALVDRLPVDILVVTAIIAAVAALEAWRRSARLEATLAEARALAFGTEAGAALDEAPLLVSTGQRQVPVPRAAVESFGAAGNYVVINWDGTEGLVRGTLKELEETLDGRRFARCHRSAIVNLAKVTSASALAEGSWRLQMESGAEVIVSRTYRDQILRRLGRERK
jgi:DNA-binding LytR/AlgR family response regulator